MIQTVAPVSQEELDDMATDKCMCPKAKTARRKKERKAKIDAYINKHFKADMVEFVNKAVEMVEAFVVDKVSINMDSKTYTIWIDSDSWLHIKMQKREDDELKA
jgi:hypothetical protein